MNGTPQISLVVPVHNEGHTIGASLDAWLAALARAGLDAECVVVDDGSTDATPDVLAASAAASSRIRVMRQPQSGHGAAVVAGYRAARGAWVLQIDGDDEIGDAYFAALWEHRSEGGLTLGRRAATSRAPVRRMISRLAALYVHLAASVRVADANVPFRVMPRTLLQEFLVYVPHDMVAPNIALTIFAGLRGWDVREVPVVEQARTTARRPLGGLRLWRTVLTALRQSRAFRTHVAGHSSRV